MSWNPPSSMFMLASSVLPRDLRLDAPGPVTSDDVPPSNETPFGALLWTVFASILEVFILCFAGWILARRGIIDKKTQKQLNRINVSLFTPSLLFSKVAFALSPQKLKELWIIPIFFVVVTLISAVVAWFLGVLFRLKRTQRNFAIAAAMFNNSNSLPIALMQSLVITVHGLKWGDDDNKDAMLGRALSYLVLYSTLGMMLRWSYGVHLLSQADDEVVPDEDPDADPEDGSATPTEHDHQPSITIAEPDETTPLSPGLVANLTRVSNGHSLAQHEPPHTITRPPRPAGARQQSSFFYSFPNTPARSRVDLAAHFGQPPPPLNLPSPDPTANLNDEWGDVLPGHGGRDILSPPSTPWESTRRRTWNRVKTVWTGFAEFMTVPMWAALASLIVACVPPAQHALQNHMQPVKGALVAAGNCSIPVTLIVLGAYFNTEESKDEPAAQIAPQVEASSSASAEERRNRHWSSSEISIATLKGSLRDAFKLRKPGSSGSSGKDSKHKGETSTVFVAILSRMILAPALVLPAVAALAWFDLQSVTEDPVFVVSMVLLVSSPPALTLAQITQAASGDAFERLISKTIFWSYCICTPPLTILYVVIGLLMSKL